MRWGDWSPSTAASRRPRTGRSIGTAKLRRFKALDVRDRDDPDRPAGRLELKGIFEEPATAPEAHGDRTDSQAPCGFRGGKFLWHPRAIAHAILNRQEKVIASVLFLRGTVNSGLGQWMRFKLTKWAGCP